MRPLRDDGVSDARRELAVDSIDVDHRLIVELRPEARRRETTVPRLISDLLSAVIDNRLFCDVLNSYDDGVSLAELERTRGPGRPPKPKLSTNG